MYFGLVGLSRALFIRQFGFQIPALLMPTRLPARGEADDAPLGTTQAVPSSGPSRAACAARAAK